MVLVLRPDAPVIEIFHPDSYWQISHLIRLLPPDGQVALRRKLSDKDKERRLVRRSSSKRKDKENGGGEKCGSQVRRGGV